MWFKKGKNRTISVCFFYQSDIPGSLECDEKLSHISQQILKGWLTVPRNGAVFSPKQTGQFLNGGSVVVDFLFIVTPIVGVCNCSMFCCTLLYVLQSSWWGRESWLLCLICLPAVSWWLSSASSRCHGVVCGLWLWYFLIILTYYF